MTANTDELRIAHEVWCKKVDWSAFASMSQDDIAEDAFTAGYQSAAAHYEGKIKEYLDADALVSMIYDEASPGLNTPRPQDHYDRLGKAITRRLAAHAALASIETKGE